MFAQQYELIVVGRVIEVLPAQWTTPDGQRPADPFSANPNEVLIITPVVVELDRLPLVNRVGIDVAAGGKLTIAAYGGQVGADRVETSSTDQTFATGDQVLLGLSVHPYLQGGVERRYETPAGLAWNVGTKYLLTRDGLAVSSNPIEEPQSANALIAAILAAVASE